MKPKFCVGSGTRAERPARIIVGMFLCASCGKPCRRIPGTGRVMDHYPDNWPEDLKGGL